MTAPRLRRVVNTVAMGRRLVPLVPLGLFVAVVLLVPSAGFLGSSEFLGSSAEARRSEEPRATPRNPGTQQPRNSGTQEPRNSEELRGTDFAEARAFLTGQPCRIRLATPHTPATRPSLCMLPSRTCRREGGDSGNGRLMTETTPCRVLVVEDEEAIRTLVVRLLRRSGFDPVEAEDGQDAIEQLEAGSFDAIVLDLMMPRVDGFGVVNHLLETRPLMIEKTVVVTAFPQAAAKERLHHVCHVLSKPFDTAELIEAVKQCVDR